MVWCRFEGFANQRCTPAVGKADWDSRTSVAALSEHGERLEILRGCTELASVFPSFRAVHSVASLAALVSAAAATSAATQHE
jgi:hypothetical protein